MRKLLLFSSAWVLHVTASYATTYQVGPSRTNKTIDAVASKLNPGDVVEVDGNATYSGGIVLDRPGAAGNPITVRGLRVNGKRPILSGGTNSIEIQGDHYVLEGFDVTQGSSRCVYHHSDDVTMRDLVVHDCPAHGLLGADQDSGSLTLEYSEFYGSGNGTGQHQIYMATDEVAHPGSVFRMQHCYVHDGVGGNSVKSRAERNEIYYNWIEGALYHELELIGPDPDGAPTGWTEGLKREDSDVVGNVLRKTRTSFVVRFGGDGTGQSNGRYRFVANTVLTQPGGSAVFRLFDGLESVEMHSNVFYVDPTPSGASTIVRDAEAVWSTGSRIVGGGHNWVLTQASSVPSEWTMTTKGADPKFAGIGSMNLRPVSGGPLADGCTCITSPSGHDFPRPLAWPDFDPPQHAAEAPGTALARSVSGQLYVGAYQPTASTGTGGAGGASNSGGTSNAGGASNAGGTSSSGGKGGTSNAGGAGNGGSGATGQGGASTGDGGATSGDGATSSVSGGRSSRGGAASGSGGSMNGGPTGNGAGPSGTGAATGAAGSGDGTSGDGTNGDAPNGDATSNDSASCGCRLGAPGGSPNRASIVLGVLSLGWLFRRRRRGRHL